MDKGYTLLELIITIGLLVGLSTLVLLNGTESRKLTQLNTAVLQLESALLQAQSYGNSGKSYPPDSSIEEDFDRGYGVYVSTNFPNTIFIYGGGVDNHDNANVSEEKFDSTRIFEEITFEGNIEILSIDMPSTPPNIKSCQALFKRGITDVLIHAEDNNGNAFNNKNEMTITLGIDSYTKDVVVNKTGLIYIDE